MIRTKLLILVVLLLVGCAGVPFSWDDARRVEAGMSKTEVERIMGTPSAVSTKEGKETWAWVYVSPFSGARSFSVSFVDDKVTDVPTVPAGFKD